MHENLKAMDELSAYVTSHAARTRAAFPNVTWPQFDRFSEYRQPHGQMGGFLVNLYAPIVSANERSQWEAYSTQNPWWSAAMDTTSGNVSEFIFPEPDHATTESTTVFAPIWQSSPTQWTWINQNLLADPAVADLYSTMMVTQQTVRSGISHIGQALFDNLLNHTHALSLNPQSILVAPVFNVRTGANRTVVGMLLSLFSYDHLFDFSKNIAGLVCVLTDPCGVNATYEIFSDNVTFLGYGDLHDPMYDERFQRSAPWETHNTTTEEGGGLCQQRVYVYPSPLYQDQFLTARPSIYTFFVIFSFCLMALLILLYEHTVTQRYEKTLEAALRTGALIASLFPENVRDRLLNEREEKDERERKVTFADERAAEASQRPIADFFANTTIMCTLPFSKRRIACFNALCLTLFTIFVCSSFAVA